ncbi:hypothetical protein [Hymenobacter siberiensis]|uniref:hypothetical protein n=1 Tax=Hymenobacter siberiensis TaxID=2848396 RepID=UPI001C1DD343|nr:hypothetical protein [Hymenobacter siberiensis]
MTIEELLQEYSTAPEGVRLRFPTESWNSTPGIQACHLGENALGLTGSVLLATVDVPGVTRKKADQFKKKTQKMALVYRDYGREGCARAAPGTGPMQDLLSSIPDCAHSHLVLELNMLAYVLELPNTIALGAWVYTPDAAPELITVTRVPELTQQLLNDAYVRTKKRAAGANDIRRVQGLAHGRPGDGGHEAPVHAGPLRAAEPGGNSTYTDRDYAATDGWADPDSRTGEGGDAAHSAPPGGAAPVQQVRRRLQQQSLF